MSEESQTGENQWMIHYQMNFWIWAALLDAKSFIDSVAALKSDEILRDAEKRHNAQQLLQLSKYHFVTTLGSLIRTLEIAAKMFPEIAPQYEASEHIRKEGQTLRGLVEHSEEYFAGEGKFPEKWVRENAAGGGTADASALVVDGKVHWIGGRLSVEQAISEIEKLQHVAQQIPMPKTSDS